MNKLIEAEVKIYHESFCELYKQGCSCEMFRQVFHRFEKALREEIFSELPAEKTKLLPDRKPEGVNVRSWAMKADRRHGFNDCLSQVKNIISGV